MTSIGFPHLQPVFTGIKLLAQLDVDGLVLVMLSATVLCCYELAADVTEAHVMIFAKTTRRRRFAVAAPAFCKVVSIVNTRKG